MLGSFTCSVIWICLGFDFPAAPARAEHARQGAAVAFFTQSY
jgi:hypothetical protein